MIELHVEAKCERCNNAWSEVVLLGPSDGDTNMAMCLACFRKLLEISEKIETLQRLVK